MTYEEADKLLDKHPVWLTTKPILATIGAMTLSLSPGAYVTARHTLRYLLVGGLEGLRPAGKEDNFVTCPHCDTTFEVGDAVLRRRQEQLAPTPRVPSARLISNKR